MKWSHIQPRMRPHVIAGLLLVVGLCASVGVYLTAENADENEYVEDYQSSKKYRHDLEVYGGQFSVMASDLNRWMGGRWRGQARAYTVAGISLMLAGGICVVAWCRERLRENPDASGGPCDARK